MRKLVYLICIILLQFSPLFAHVGSPGVVMQGEAGPYKILVNVTPPDVIPGVAKVTAYIQSGQPDAVTLRAVYFRSGDEGAPEADPMTTEGKGQYSGSVWLMNGGSSSIQLSINGREGKGELIVPVVAISVAKKDMPKSTGWVLAGLGVLLFVLMVTIIGASVSDALTKRGERVSARRKRVRIAGIGIAALLTSLVVYGGNAWWQSWADDYRQYMFQPMQASSVVKSVNGSNELIFTLDTGSQRHASFSYVVPDHGKMMHMFIMRMPAMDAFAHLHPMRIDSAHYRTILPGLPKGKYLAFADIVYKSGFTETIKDTFEIAGNLTDSLRKLDKDDACAYALPADVIDNPQLADKENTIICGKPGTGARLKDGSTMVWEGMTNEPLETGKLYNFLFSVLTPDKKPAKLEPYLGMGGHAAIVRNDGNVYIHLHPVGTYSVAAETNLISRMADPQGVYVYPAPKKFRDSIDNYVKYLSGLDAGTKDRELMKNMVMPQGEVMNGMQHGNSVQFPYSFPSPGQYRIWVQVKRNGQVLTGAFDKIVK